MDRHGLGATRALYLRLAGAPAADAGLRRLAAEPVEWGTLRALARREGLGGEVWRRLRSTGAVVPGEVADAWAREARVADFHLLRMERWLGEACRTLEGCGARPLLLKGAGLAYSAYGGLRRRPMSDLDLLVAPGELAAARAALEAAGWRPAAADDGYAAHHHAPPLADPAGEGVIVELHHELVPGAHPFAFTGSEVAERAREVRVPWGTARVPEPVDQLLHVALHFAWSHELRWGGWRAFADVAALLGAEGSDEWRPAIRGRAARAGLERVLGWTLRLSAEVGGVALPPEAEAMVRRGGTGAPRLARHLAHQLVPGPGASPSVALARAAWEGAVRPPRAGAGGSGRPWQARGAAGAGRPAGLGRRLGRQVVRARAWLDYVRALARRAGRNH